MAARVIVCIHGIWVRRGIFWYLRKALKPCGVPVHLFGYPSIRKSLHANAQTLKTFVDKLNAEQVDFVAHSLGGLLLFHYFTLTQNVPAGRIVLMGTPLQGSAIARIGAKYALLKPLLGKNHEQLQQGIAQWSAPGKTIMIAGTRSIGVGRIFPHALAGPNDGTVTVAETRHPQLFAHYEIAESHSSMLYSRSAVQIIREFLE